MIADLGTRKGCTLVDVGPDLTWINGYTWMKLEFDKFPVKSVKEITLSNEDIQKMKGETPLIHPCISESLHTDCFTVSNKISDEVKARYE